MSADFAAARSPTTNTSGWFGIVRSGPTITRPEPSSGTPSDSASGFAFTEGACYVPTGDFFVWSDIPNNRIWRWSERTGLAIFREPTGNANGNTVDHQGRLLSCETSGRKVTVTEPDGRTWTLVDQYQGRRLTSPNDIVVKSDGTVWFTDTINNVGNTITLSAGSGGGIFRLDQNQQGVVPTITGGTISQLARQGSAV